MKPKRINVTEVVRELDVHSLEGETLVGYEDCFINVSYSCNWGEPPYTIELTKTRPETDEEYDKRVLADAEFKKKKKQDKEKKLEAEKREYERLKKKFGSAEKETE
jgi:hypothetical protein